MKLVDLDINEFNQFLKIHDLENMFDVFSDRKGNNVCNLNKSLYVAVDIDALPDFTCDYEMHWTLISYKIYGTTRLAWLLWKLNGVNAKDIFKAKQPKDKVKYLPTRYSDAIVADINEFNQG